MLQSKSHIIMMVVHIVDWVSIDTYIITLCRYYIELNAGVNHDHGSYIHYSDLMSGSKENYLTILYYKT